MNLTRSQKVRLGAFVATGLTLLSGAILVLAGLKVWERHDLYTVRFKDSVSGLEGNAQVRYQGLRVGRVETMRVAPDDPTAIEVTLAIDPRTELHEGSVATMDMSGITGLKTINLTPGDPRKPKLPPGSAIPAGVSFVDRLTGQAEAITLKVEMIANQLARWTADENRIRFERLLESSSKLTEDLDRLVADARAPTVSALEEVARTGAAVRGAASEGAAVMRDVRTDLHGAIAQTRQAIGEINRILKAVDAGEVAATVKATHTAMSRLQDRVSERELGKALLELQTTLAGVTQLLQEVDLTVRASREDFVSSLQQVRQATEDLREFSRIIAQDPSALIRGKEVEE